jgi:hypothetical protein
MLKEVNILTVNTQILDNFRDESSKLDEYKSKLKEIKNSLELKNIKPRIIATLKKTKEELTNHINDIETNTSLNFYMTETAEMLEKYKEILNAPMKVNFIGKVVKNNKEKQKLILNYLDIAGKYVNIELPSSENTKSLSILEKKEKIACNNCDNKKDFDILEGNIYICSICSAQQVIMKNVSSYKDNDRINITSKYCYDRKIHFRDSINQYQGKQNSTINQKVYNELETQFELHHLLVGDKDTPKEIRFKNINKKHISIFLKELEYTKHYENINLIHYNMTGEKPDDISYLEDKLLEDFDTLTETYDRKFKNIDRKNFINTQYILYQLLLRHKHPCSKENFTILKTIDRKNFHDDITRVLFMENGWNFTPFI